MKPTLPFSRSTAHKGVVRLPPPHPRARGTPTNYHRCQLYKPQRRPQSQPRLSTDTPAPVSSRRWSSTAPHPHPTPRPRPKTALFFPGQGVQRTGMTTPWLTAFPRTCLPFLEETDAILSLPPASPPLSHIIATGPNAILTQTENAQPAIFATSIMILRVLEREFGFDPRDRVDVVLGHSLGEFAALVAGGYLEYPAALAMVRGRAEVMARCSREAVVAAAGDGGSEGVEYGMVALVCEPEHLAELVEAIHAFLGHGVGEGARMDSGGDVPPIEEVSVANVNSKNQIVLAGNLEQVRALLVQLRQFAGHDPRAVKLATECPFHSPLMGPAREFMRERLRGEGVVRWEGSLGCVSNVSGRFFGDAGELRDLLARQCTETVRWWDSIRFLDQEVGVRRWVGLGPGKVGRNLVGKEVGIRGREEVRGGGVWGISEPREVEEVLRGLEITERMG